MFDTSYFDIAKVYYHDCRHLCECGKSLNITHYVLMDKAAYADRAMRENFSGYIYTVGVGVGTFNALVCDEDSVPNGSFAQV